MPELPEIETLKRSLESHLVNKTIIGVKKYRSSLRYELPIALESQILAAKIVSLRRRAKYLIIDLDNANSLIIHLGMSGRFTLQPVNYQLQKHDHLIFYLDHNLQLVFNDARRFGMVYVFPASNLAEQKILKNFGVEPLSEEFNAEYLLQKLSSKRVPIKTALMENNVVVGIGNIYASESLFLAKIHPQKLGNTLSYMEIGNLIKAIKVVLEKAISAGGTSLKDFVSGENRPGYFKQELLVYGRAKQACYQCNEEIIKIKQAGRASFYCLNCQNL